MKVRVLVLIFLIEHQLSNQLCIRANLWHLWNPGHLFGVSKLENKAEKTQREFQFTHITHPPSQQSERTERYICLWVLLWRTKESKMNPTAHSPSRSLFFFACLFLKYPASIVQISITNLQPLEADTFVSSRRSKVLIATSAGLILHPSDVPDKPLAGWSSKSLLAGAVYKNWMRRFSLYILELHKGFVDSSVTVV